MSALPLKGNEVFHCQRPLLAPRLGAALPRRIDARQWWAEKSGWQRRSKLVRRRSIEGSIADFTAALVAAEAAVHLWRCRRWRRGGRLDVPQGEVIVMPSPSDVAAAVCQRMAAACAGAISTRGSACVALGGPAIPLLRGLGGSSKEVDWERVHLAYADHRCVPLEDPLSSHHLAREVFADEVGLRPEHELAPDGAADAIAEAVRYQRRLLALPHSALPRDGAGLPVFDSIVAGLSQDGRIGALVPGRREVRRRDAVVLSVSAPGEEASITLSVPVLSAAREVIVTAVGSDKARAVRAALEQDSDDCSLDPAKAFHPLGGTTWMLDAEAAALLS